MKKREKATKPEVERKRRFSEAEKSLRKMLKDIAPFMKPRKLIEYSTAGEWRESSSYDFQSRRRP